MFDQELEAVYSKIDALNCEVQGLQLENDILEHHFMWLNDEMNCSGHINNESVNPCFDSVYRQARQRRRNTPTKLSAVQKHDIANLRLELILAELSNRDERLENVTDTLYAVLEETDIRVRELRKHAYEFKRDIVIGAENMRTGKTTAEGFIRYMDEKLRQRDSLTDKLRFKNTTLRTHLQKVEAQLKHKEEMGDVLHYIDFHQLQIENKQYLTQIEAKNHELLQLKDITSKAVQALNCYKHRMLGTISATVAVQSEIQSRNEQISNACLEGRSVQSDLCKEAAFNNRQQMEFEEQSLTQTYVEHNVRTISRAAYSTIIIGALAQPSMHLEVSTKEDGHDDTRDQGFWYFSRSKMNMTKKA